MLRGRRSTWREARWARKKRGTKGSNFTSRGWPLQASPVSGMTDAIDVSDGFKNRLRDSPLWIQRTRRPWGAAQCIYSFRPNSSTCFFASSLAMP